ncbi:MAG: RNA methyltransferase [Alphaproteobacteria bacterium]|jgi:tRNA/rRNA methyltransferase|nr:RNA methyltransferase [Alphaproteobacteria bacterium]
MTPPCIILVEPQLDQNIGKVARAMLNFGLTDLRLVRPQTEWHNETARRLSAGAEGVLENARAFDDLMAASFDLHHLYATTARPRDMIKEVLTPREAAPRIFEDVQTRGERVGLLFGPERCGLENQDIALSKAVITVPLNPAFSSLNLAQAVVVVAYEYYQAQGGIPKARAAPAALAPEKDPPATKEELQGFLEQLDQELEKSGYFRAAHRRAVMTQSLHNMFSRMDYTSQEVRTLRGVVAALVNPNGIYSRPKRKRGD